MRVVDDIRALERGKPSILTIGAFDGVHRGHQFLIRQVVDRARTLQFDSTVVTFDPRPQVVLRPGNRQLTAGAEKTRLMRALGVGSLVVLPFSTELSQVGAGQFVATLLDHVNLAEVWVGGDFAFGHQREGNVDFLIRSGQKSGFAVHVLFRQRLGDTPISSTVVRELVEAGDVAGAAVLLGHYFSLQGEIVAGHNRGKDLGFPTANFKLPDSQVVPGTGIYAAFLRLDEERLPAAVSVGTNPTFGGGEVVVEAYVLDFDGDLRGRSVSLDFVDKIRDERKFESVDALVEEMNRDVARIRLILEQSEEPGELLL